MGWTAHKVRSPSGPPPARKSIFGCIQCKPPGPFLGRSQKHIIQIYRTQSWILAPAPAPDPVSYTHLTLPTICSV